MRVYLDHNASSPLRPEAREAVREALDGGFGNPSSLHAEGRRARALVERARGSVARLLGAREKDVVFTSGGSEAIAAAVRGVCDQAPGGRTRLVVGAVEHSAVLEAARREMRRGFEVVVIAPDASGRVAADAFAAAIDDRTALAALQAANNETGVIQPSAEVGRICREACVPFLLDAVQAAGKVEIDRCGPADLVAISAHKFGGPQGAGALVVREGLVLQPLIAGGAQERRRRAGTEAVAAIAGFGAAAEAAARDLAGEAARLLSLREAFEQALRRPIPDVRVHGAGAPRLANTTCFSIPGVDGEVVVIALDLEGFAVSTGSACASGAVETSHVLRAMGLADAEARGAVRVSLGWSTRAEDVERLAAVLPRLSARMRAARAEMS